MTTTPSQPPLPPETRLLLENIAVAINTHLKADAACSDTAASHKILQVVRKPFLERQLQFGEARKRELNNLLNNCERFEFEEEEESGRQLKLSSKKYFRLHAAYVHGTTIIEQMVESTDGPFEITNDNIKKLIMQNGGFTDDDVLPRPTTDKQTYSQKYLDSAYEPYRGLPTKAGVKNARQRYITLDKYVELTAEFPSFAEVFLKS